MRVCVGVVVSVYLFVFLLWFECFSSVGLYVVCSLFALFVPLCVVLCECLCVYVMACMWCLFNDSIGSCCVCCYVIVSFFCCWCVWFVCGMLCCCVLFHRFVVRVCFVVVVLFSLFKFCYGSNDFPVCDRMLYVPYLRRSFLFV